MKTYTAKERFELAFQLRFDLPYVEESLYDEPLDGCPLFEDLTAYLLASAALKGKSTSEFNKLYPLTEDDEILNSD